MLENLQIYLTPDNIYLFSNWGVIPFWILLIFFPNEAVTKILVHSVVVPFLFASAYIYIAIEIFLNDNIFQVFNLYFGLDEIYTVFSNEKFLLIFWLHFLSISLLVGSWITRDSIKFNIPKVLLSISLIITYFSGPVGLVFYWFFRIFFSKKVSFND
tara:strand:- start:472 stop:942 length:471 start_codon:yes stop_codon:yes gene_type:complete